LLLQTGEGERKVQRQRQRQGNGDRERKRERVRQKERVRERQRDREGAVYLKFAILRGRMVSFFSRYLEIARGSFPNNNKTLTGM
jgi:hypothetical protein